jgi:molybdopterin-containing oxidoreductase family membrane subunit
MDEASRRVEEAALAPLQGTGRGYALIVAMLLSVLGAGTYAYSRQLSDGLSVTGMAPTVNKIMWGIYIVNFVFFIGISHAGTLISAILRVSHAEWRRPVTRMAEFITVVALSVGALFPIIDLGRPDRMLNVIRYGRWESPILWDLFAITTYLAGSLLYLFLPLIPDLATCRDRLAGRISAPRRLFYRLGSVGWTGAPDQRRSLAFAMTIMMLLIIPVAISVHTVVSWIFGMTLRTGWNSTVFGAFFVAGAIFSGIATIIIVMAVLRKIYHLEEFITEKHFVALGYMLAAFGLIMLYGNLSEYVTAGYKMEGNAPVHLGQIFTGSFAPIYWSYLLGGLLLPGFVMLMPWSRKIWTVVTVAILVDIAMWFERYIIVVATLRSPQMPYKDLASYFPTWVEILITAGAFALFILLISFFVKLVPILSIWEMREGYEIAEGTAVVERRTVEAIEPRPAVGS